MTKKQLVDDPRLTGYGIDFSDRGHDVEYYRSIQDLTDPAQQIWAYDRLRIEEIGPNPVFLYKVWMRPDAVSVERTELITRDAYIAAISGQERDQARLERFLHYGIS